jgi:exodeoxyribonuclease V alpha subunit
MNDIIHLGQIIQVKKTRAWGFATVNMINNDGSIRVRDKTLVVQFPSNISEAAKAGTLWEVSGKERLNQFELKDFTVSEYVIAAENIKYLRPSGRVLSRWLSSNIKGIGTVIANRLVRLNNLNKLIDDRNKVALLEVGGMNNKRVERLFEQWPNDHLHKTIEWLEAQRLPLGLGVKLFSLFGSNSIEKIKSHPFLLLAMGVSFEKTMEVAISLGFSMSDDRVIAGIALYVAIQYASKTGSTVIESKTLKNGLSRISKVPSDLDIGKIATEYGLLVKVNSGYQIYGSALMEAAVARFICETFDRAKGAHSSSSTWEINITYRIAEKALAIYEATLKFPLTGEQREAVINTVLSNVCCITGGAGTGKTTIIKAILAVYAAVTNNIPVFQIALSGRAAQRMAESTGLPAQTIAKLIFENSGSKRIHFPEHALVIIDEASMIDLFSMYRLTKILPPATRLVFVGDTSQLPPVGAGLIFQTLTNTHIPFFNLSQVKRLNESSQIHIFATSIRESALEIPEKTQRKLVDSSDCSLESNSNIPRLLELWDEAGGVGDIIVLSPTKQGLLGVYNINISLQAHVGIGRPVLHYQDPSKGWIAWITNNGSKILEGDPVIIIANNYNPDVNIRNGEFGKIIEVFETPDIDGAFGILAINDLLLPITTEILDKFELGYAITIHKSQGSEWKTCFVVLPDEAKDMIDQTLLYTATTRSSKKLVLFGNAKVLENAVRKGSQILYRKTYLRQRILSLTNAN